MIFPEGKTSRAEVIHAMRYFEPVSSFRSKFDYDNLLYIVAGEVVARVAGMPFEDFLEQIHSEDRERIAEVLVTAARTDAARGVVDASALRLEGVGCSSVDSRRICQARSSSDSTPRPDRHVQEVPDRCRRPRL